MTNTGTRRGFIAKSALAGTPLAFPMLARARSEQVVKWRLASSYPKSLDTIFGISDHVAKKIAAMTDNEFQIRVFAAGELVGPLAVMDAVQNAGVEAGHTASVYYTGKDKTFAFDTGVPYGMTPRQHLGWQYRGGGIETFRPLDAKHFSYSYDEQLLRCDPDGDPSHTLRTPRTGYVTVDQ